MTKVFWGLTRQMYWPDELAPWDAHSTAVVRRKRIIVSQICSATSRLKPNCPVSLLFVQTERGDYQLRSENVVQVQANRQKS